MSGTEERQRAVDLCSATPMTTAQVVEHLGHPTRQCLERWPAKDSQYAGHMDRPIIPLETRTKTIEPVPGGMRGSGPPNGSARASARSATGSGRIERAVLLQFFLSNFCTIFPQHRLLVSSGNCTI